MEKRKIEEKRGRDMEKERGLTKRKIEETGVNQQQKSKSQAIFLSSYFKSSFNPSGLINTDILNVLAYKQICALYFTKLKRVKLPSSNKTFGMQLIATDNNWTLHLVCTNKQTQCLQ